jgi:multidrug efflux pump subunit AcrA (membrane-fusion protein)
MPGARAAAALGLLAALAAPGCGSEEQERAPSVSKPPALQVIHPELRTLGRRVGQPSFVQSYERTSIYPKMDAYIEKWNVDIGDRVQKGDVLADLFVPELRELWETKKATVAYDVERVRLAEEDVEVAAAEVSAAEARLKEARAILAKYEAEVERWQVQVDRLAREVERQVVAPQILLESQNELKADIAAREEAQATIAKAEAELEAANARLARAKINVAAAEADLQVARSEARRLEALVGYLKLFAPYDGIVVARNANTWDFVLPRTGDPTAMMRTPFLSPGGQAAPIYVIDRTDIVRVYVDIPERDAKFVREGSEARVRIWAYRDAWIPATVTRLSWALNPHSRTMRAEIDLPNPDGQIRPDMYAYGEVVVQRPGAWALPKAAITHAGGKSFVWRYEGGKAVRTEVETGVRGGDWIEVTNLHARPATAGAEAREGGSSDQGDPGGDPPGDDPSGRDVATTGNPEEDEWVAIDGTEPVLIGSDLSTLTDGAEVRLADAPSAGPRGAGGAATAGETGGGDDGDDDGGRRPARGG